MASMRCPRCGTDRLIPLTFSVAPVGADPSPDLSERPLMKCVACGQRLYARDVHPEARA
jgi:DNA-directed RNA polymerase subunit RPC12/RpoP